MSGEADFDEINEAKANMDHIYDRPDPRAYFRELRKLGYAIPGLAKPIFQKLISSLRWRSNHPVRVLDLGCSYGVNAALLKHDLSLQDLYEHWGSDGRSGAAPEQIVAQDRNFFGDLGTSNTVEVIGLDQAGPAVAFAEEAGLIDNGLALNLETEPLPLSAKKDLAQVDLVTSTGCVGYVTEKTFSRLLPVVTQGRPPWMANFVARLFPFDPIEATLDEWGYATEKLEGRAFVQRRFASDDERERVIDQLSDLGVDATGKETNGYFMAEFFLSRPAGEVAKAPIDRLLSTS